MAAITDTAEQVVLCTPEGAPTGTADKATVHTRDTPLHLAFSAWLFDASGRTLLSRRAVSKKTWPGVWTNSFCGHPGPGEVTEDAVIRRASQELGLPAEALRDIRLVLPDFRYRAVDATGIVENEICPVYAVALEDGFTPDPNRDEVEEYRWVEPGDLVAAVDALPFVFSPWLVEEITHPQLQALWG